MMNREDTPFLSVIIPVYNSVQYLDECLESVMRQTITDFEVVLVDDESTDGSSQVCDKWASRFPEIIRVIHQENTGVYIAKRNGIKNSKGRYIYVMDNDDLLVSDHAFETVKNAIDLNGCDLAIFNATDDINTGHLLCRLPFENGRIFEAEALAELYDEFLRTKSLHHIWMMVFDRSNFDWDYEYCESNRMLRDGPSLIIPILSNTKRAIYINETFYYWRIQNQNSASKHYDVLNFYRSIRHLHERVLNYSRKWKYKSSETDMLVRSNYVMDICIAAIKVRTLSPNAPLTRKEFLRLLSDDNYFRDEYTLSHLESYRKIIAYALYHRQFLIVNTISSIVGILKRR